MVASWANQAGPGTGICWRDLRGDHDLVAVLDGLPAELAAARVTAACGWSATQRPSSARVTSTALDRSIIVLDDFPVDPGDGVAAALDRLVHRVGHRVALVLVCSGPPALDLQRLGVSPECRDRHLRGSGAEPGGDRRPAVSRGRRADPGHSSRRSLTGRAGGRGGFAWVHRCWPDRRSVAVALHETDLAIADYLRHSILRDVSDPSAELLTATSMVADVSPDVAAAVIGDERGLPDAIVTQTRGFVRMRADGSFTVHPLLRRHLQNQLRRRPSAARAAVRRAARVHRRAGRPRGRDLHRRR